MGIRKETCEKIREMFKAGISIADISKKYNLSENLIKSICNR